LVLQDSQLRWRVRPSAPVVILVYNFPVRVAVKVADAKSMADMAEVATMRELASMPTSPP
jgi:hypothetical protein